MFGYGGCGCGGFGYGGGFALIVELFILLIIVGAVICFQVKTNYAYLKNIKKALGGAFLCWRLLL